MGEPGTHLIENGRDGCNVELVLPVQIANILVVHVELSPTLKKAIFLLIASSSINIFW